MVNIFNYESSISPEAHYNILGEQVHQLILSKHILVEHNDFLHELLEEADIFDNEYAVKTLKKYNPETYFANK